MHPHQQKHAFYHVHLMAALAVSLAVVTICFNLPFTFDPAPKPWKPRLGVLGSNEESERSAILASTIHTSHGAPSTGTTLEIFTPDTPVIKEDTVPKEAEFRVLKSSLVPVLDRAEIMPKVRGGLGAYYILVEYPEEAINRGIEGKLVLTFTVNQDGRTSDIQVTQPLHALLDSAAVQALHRTRFIPGQHLGKSVRTRMRLPVRFELINSPDSTHITLSTSKETSE